MERELPDEAATTGLGQALAGCLRGGTVVHLEGELGAGKTTLVRGLLRALGHQGAVRSPTYTLVEEYPFDSVTIHHFDLYRLGDPEELEYLGIRDYFRADTVALIEWPERGCGFLPKADLTVQLDYAGAGGRIVRIVPNSPAGTAVLDCLS